MNRTEIRLSNCTFIKTILMMLVIFGHSIAFWNGTWIEWKPVYSSPILAMIYNWINSFHVYAFTLVSGYIFSYKTNMGGYESFVTFFVKKVKRLIVPYTFVACCWVVPISYYCFNWNHTIMIRRYLLCTNPSQLWFLWMLFWVFVIVWPFRKIILNSTVSAVLLAITFYCIGIICGAIFDNYFCIWTGFSFIPFFIIGMLLYKFEINDVCQIIYSIPWFVWVIAYSILLFLLQQILAMSPAVEIKILKISTLLLVHVIGSIMSFVILQKVSTSFDWKNRKLFSLLSNYSMPIYLFHQQIIYFTIIWFNGLVNPYINSMINFFTAIVCSLAISYILLKFKATTFLIGEKD